MNPYLSKTMPELTAQQISWLGSYTVSHYNEKIESYVTCKYVSLQYFADHANITLGQAKSFEAQAFSSDNRQASVTLDNGTQTTLYIPW